MTKHRNGGRASSGTTTVPLCPAMKKARIVDPDSPEGIDFCTEQCPYPKGCVAANDASLTKYRIAAEKRKARRLYKKGLSVEDIASMIKKSSTTVRRYLQ